MRPCSSCGAERPAGRRDRYCAPCRKAYREAHRAAINAGRRERTAAAAEQKRRWAEGVAHYREFGPADTATRRQKRRATVQRQRDADRAAYNQYVADWRAAHPERRREHTLRYRQKKKLLAQLAGPPALVVPDAGSSTRSPAWLVFALDGSDALYRTTHSEQDALCWLAAHGYALAPDDLLAPV